MICKGPGATNVPRQPQGSEMPKPKPAVLDPLADGFKMETWPLYWVTRVGRLYASELETALKRIGMDLAGWRVLMILDELGTASVSSIADHAVIKLPTMTKTVSRLERDGLVQAFENSQDRRVTLVRATRAGKEKTSLVKKQAGLTVRTAFHGISGEEATSRNRILAKVFANLTNDPR